MEVQQLPCLGGSLLPNLYLYFTLFVTDFKFIEIYYSRVIIRLF